MHPQTLRIYEARGLITPKRSPKNTRLYSQEDVRAAAPDPGADRRAGHEPRRRGARCSSSRRSSSGCGAACATWSGRPSGWSGELRARSSACAARSSASSCSTSRRPAGARAARSRRAHRARAGPPPPALSGSPRPPEGRRGTFTLLVLAAAAQIRAACSTPSAPGCTNPRWRAGGCDRGRGRGAARRASARLYGDVVAVDGIDLDIAPDEFFTMLGPSGSGKTTCLRHDRRLRAARRGPRRARRRAT